MMAHMMKERIVIAPNDINMKAVERGTPGEKGHIIVKYIQDIVVV